MPQDNPLRLKLALQRFALQLETLWAALHWPVVVALAGLALMWSGLMPHLPRGVPLALLIFLGLLFLYSLRGLIRMKAPSDHAALRKLDEHNALAHRAASSLLDQRLEGSGAEDLWLEHLRRKLASLYGLKVAPPASHARDLDPWVLRLPAVLAALVAFILGDGDVISGTQNAFTFTPAATPKPVILDAWLKPPAYTGKPPILLTSPAMIEKLKAAPDLAVPENSLLNLRLTGAKAPKVEFLSPGASDAVNLSGARVETKDGTLTADAKMSRPATVRVMDGDEVLASWQIGTITDAAPQIEIVGEPEGDAMGRLKLKWHASDDYGVKSITAEVSLSDDQADGKGFAGNGVFLYDAPQLKIAMGKPGAKEDSETTQADLSGHAWAGLYVDLALTATDGAGHATTTPPKRVKLPERDFIKPLARAFVEQRKSFILAPEAAQDASAMIDVIMKYPFTLEGRAGLILNIDALNARLASASAPEDVSAVTTELWPLIIAIEDGQLADVKAELKTLANELREALRNGAPKDKIDELMRRMDEAMKRLAEKLQKDGQKQAQKDPRKDGAPQKLVSPQQLQDMLDQIQKLQRQGDIDGAEQLLSQLDEMLQNLRPGQGQTAEGGQPGQTPLDGLNGLLGDQRKLTDKTQRQGKGGNGSPPGDSTDGLADQQKALRDKLGKLGQGLGKEQGGDKLGEAGRAMGEAERNLREGNKDEALRQQKNAMRALREGMGKLAETLRKQDGNRDGRADGESGTDPLGRPRPSFNPGVEPNRNLVPPELARRRAQEILDELRGRANAEGLDQETRSYINRLLNGQQ